MVQKHIKSTLRFLLKEILGILSTASKYIFVLRSVFFGQVSLPKAEEKSKSQSQVTTCASATSASVRALQKG